VRLHLIDGTYELYRAHFAPRPGHTDPTGVDCKATVGVVASLLSLLHDPAEDVTHLAVAFDNPIRSFRNDLFPAYKSDDGVPPELRSQFDRVEDAVRAIGVPVWSMGEYEADDALATGARMFRDAVDQVRVMTPDKDLAQCLVGTRVVQVDRRQNKVTDEASFRATRGYGPESVPDFLALTGDTADGIPGLPGFGEKSAATLVGAYQHLEHIPDDVRAWKVAPRGAARLAETLAARRTEAFFYRKLATLIDAVPLAESLDELRFRGVPRQRFDDWCAGTAAQRLAVMPQRWEPSPA
jgi:5'-3' exonuclease